MTELGIEIASATREWVELSLPCELNAVQRVQEYLRGLDADLPRKPREAVAEALHELLMNAVEWGGRFDPSLRVKVSRIRGARMVMYHIADPGTGYRMDELRHAAIHYNDKEPLAHLNARHGRGIRAGGFGLLLVRELVDELFFNHARNEVVFVKYL
jgi:anti-sigma regulatory factor (Ser/Thr protein kinase)